MHPCEKQLFPPASAAAFRRACIRNDLLLIKRAGSSCFFYSDRSSWGGRHWECVSGSDLDPAGRQESSLWGGDDDGLERTGGKGEGKEGLRWWRRRWRQWKWGCSGFTPTAMSATSALRLWSVTFREETMARRAGAAGREEWQHRRRQTPGF